MYFWRDLVLQKIFLDKEFLETILTHTLCTSDDCCMFETPMKWVGVQLFASISKLDICL